MKRLSKEFKKSAFEKLLHRGSRPLAAIIEEIGIPKKSNRKEPLEYWGFKKCIYTPRVKKIFTPWIVLRAGFDLN